MAIVKSPPEQPEPCPLCQRPNHHPSDHHLVPKSRGGRVTETLCADCHRGIHATFTNKELESTYNTAEALLSHEGFRKMVEFIAKQDPGGKVRMRVTKARGTRRRSG
ncbi:uncharacterized protein CMC5_025950 [Chondromyces crocatus]|uniref:HNH endonuclease n=2 Tax=Chondromyces crocatus TaxID=52 RepID=A0A0K1EC65_CHOCO|nr:uncharacterized protein CMC5_025950 [Chondromyces crocatus]